MLGQYRNLLHGAFVNSIVTNWVVRRPIAIWAALGVFATRNAWACGVSGPDGAMSCSLAEHRAGKKLHWQVDVSGSYTSTALRFSGTNRAEESRSAIVISIARQLSPNLTLATAIGAAPAGNLKLARGQYEFSPGPVVGAGLSWRVVEGSPFVLLTSMASYFAARTQLNGTSERALYEAFDLRLGTIVGTTLWDTIRPYAAARAFGGPVFWRYDGATVTGTDTHHYQIGAGILWAVVDRFELHAEGVPLGERAISGGAAITF